MKKKARRMIAFTAGLQKMHPNLEMEAKHLTKKEVELSPKILRMENDKKVM